MKASGVHKFLLGIICLLAMAGCESIMPPLPGIHYRTDAMSFTMAEAQGAALSLGKEVSAATGFTPDTISVVEDKYSASVYAQLRDDKGFVISIGIYPRDHSLFLDIRGPSIRLGRADRIERREQELADITRRIVNSRYPDHPLRIWTPKQGLLGP